MSVNQFFIWWGFTWKCINAIIKYWCISQVSSITVANFVQLSRLGIVWVSLLVDKTWSKLQLYKYVALKIFHLIPAALLMISGVHFLRIVCTRTFPEPSLCVYVHTYASWQTSDQIISFLHRNMTVHKIVYSNKCSMCNIVYDEDLYTSFGHTYMPYQIYFFVHACQYACLNNETMPLAVLKNMGESS